MKSLCVCGKLCKSRSGHATHARKCPDERARSARFVELAQAGVDPWFDLEARPVFNEDELLTRRLFMANKSALELAEARAAGGHASVKA